ncbi:MAG: hypothetical protein IJ172_08615 [Ruminococcus sp.]|nr:hypothetical protein [Ruminococcus sp.]
MNTLFIVIILEYIGLPTDAAKIIAFMLYIALATLIVGALISTINISTYAKKLNEQNEEIKKQNRKILKGLSIIIENQNIQSEEEIKSNTEDNEQH